jgi:uncharacterized protein (DUF1778 family)
MEAEQKHKVTVEFTEFEWKLLQAAAAYDSMSVEKFVKAHVLSAVANSLETAGCELEQKWSVNLTNDP